MIDYDELKPETRPQIWDDCLTVLLAKKADAQTLRAHRPMALMRQGRKLFLRWLLLGAPITGEEKEPGKSTEKTFCGK